MPQDAPASTGIYTCQARFPFSGGCSLFPFLSNIIKSRKEQAMKKRGQLLRIRPFNMANFSGAGGYIPLMAMFGACFSFPATFFLWTGLVVSLKNEDGKLNYSILKRRLNRIILPICIASSIPWIIFCVNQFSFYGVSFSSIMLSIWTTTVHSVGMYFPIFCSAKYLNDRNNLTKNKWLLMTLAFAVLMVIIGFVVSFLWMSIGWV